MANSDSWVKEFRKAIKTNIGSGWQVSNDRGNMRLLYGSKETGRTSINLPFSWQENQWFEAFKFNQGKNNLDLLQNCNYLVFGYFSF